MKIKRFSAPTLKEAVDQMKKELGNNAIVLESRKVKKNGVFDFSEKEAMEVLAAVGDDNKGGKVIEPNLSKSMLEIQNLKSNENLKFQEIEFIKEEIYEIKNTIIKIADFLRYKNLPSLPENLLLVLKQLLDCDVDEMLAKRLIQDVHLSLKDDEYNDLKLILGEIINKISKIIKTANDVEKVGTTAKIVAFVGPTGVGKTTTLAKLATKAKLIDGKNVSIISADTFRIAAVEQLRTFTEIAEIPFKVVYSIDDLKKAVLQFNNTEQIFIDITGRSQKDSKNLTSIKNMLSSVEPGEVHLVLSACTKYKDILDILEKFKTLFVNRLIFTKLDETTSLGVILNVTEKIKKPISYITFGQNIPEDIARADSRKLAKMILRKNFI